MTSKISGYFAKLKTLKNQLEKYNKISSKRDDLYTLCELAIEEGDESIIGEIEKDFKEFKKIMKNLNYRLF